MFTLHEELVPQVNALPTRAYYEISGGEKYPLCDFAFAYFPKAAEELLTVCPAVREPVPFCWQMRGYDSHQYSNDRFPFPYAPPKILKENPAGVYVTEFVRPAPTGKYYINFDGVDSCLYLYINGEFVGYSSVSHSGAEFDITRYLKAKNTIRIIVFKWNAGSYLEDQDKFRMSGIFRDVYILRRPVGHMRDFTVKTDVEGTTGIIEVNTDRPCEATLSYLGETLFSAAGKTFRFAVEKAALWTAETPALYDLTLSCAGETICERVGIRRVEVRGARLLLNGKAIKLKGVNRHSFTEKGYVETADDMIRDLRLMKENNINAIRTSHYPPHPMLPRLCDELGIYLLEEADVECHGTSVQRGAFDGGDFDALAEDPRYKEQFLHRVQRMYGRDKNRSSVIIWSLGNESGWGKNLAGAARWLRRDGRPIHYEGTWDNIRKVHKRENVLSFYSRMYPDLQWLETFSETADRPVILCEYTHAMGNSCGDAKDYWDVIYARESICGAFVWEWCSESVEKDGKICYGGDFGDYPNAGPFCMDGLLTCARVPNPSLYELKEVYAPVDVIRRNGKYIVLNRRDFRDLSDLVVHAEIKRDGRTIHMEARRLFALAGGFEEVKLPAVTGQGYDYAEFTFYQGDRRVAVRQIPIHEDYFSDGQRDARTAQSLPFELCFDRARIDNDTHISDEWERYDLSRARFFAVSDKTEAGTRTVEGYFGADALRPIAHVVYKTFTAGGAMQAEINVDVEEDLRCLPRVGVRFALGGEMREVTWFGRGFEEAYIDRHLAAPIGLYSGNCDTMNYRYPHPQESGSHADSRFVAVSDGKRGYLFDAETPFSFAVTPYDYKTYPAHDADLKDSGKVFVHLDAKMAGVGSAACGPELAEKYCVNEKHIRFCFRVTPFEAGEDLFRLHRSN